MVSVVFSGFLTCFCRVSVVFLWFLSFSRGFWTMCSKLGRMVDLLKRQNVPKHTGKHTNTDAPGPEIRISVHVRRLRLVTFSRVLCLIPTSRGHQLGAAIWSRRHFSPGVSVHFGFRFASGTVAFSLRSAIPAVRTVRSASRHHQFGAAIVENRQFFRGVSVHFGSTLA